MRIATPKARSRCESTFRDRTLPSTSTTPDLASRAKNTNRSSSDSSAVAQPTIEASREGLGSGSRWCATTCAPSAGRSPSRRVLRAAHVFRFCFRSFKANTRETRARIDLFVARRPRAGRLYDRPDRVLATSDRAQKGPLRAARQDHPGNEARAGPLHLPTGVLRGRHRSPLGVESHRAVAPGAG